MNAFQRNRAMRRNIYGKQILFSPIISIVGILSTSKTLFTIAWMKVAASEYYSLANAYMANEFT